MTWLNVLFNFEELCKGVLLVVSFAIFHFWCLDTFFKLKMRLFILKVLSVFIFLIDINPFISSSFYIRECSIVIFCWLLSIKKQFYLFPIALMVKRLNRILEPFSSFFTKHKLKTLKKVIFSFHILKCTSFLSSKSKG